jgi:ribonucleoside-diphosphate reductase alpha chain
MHNEVPVTKKVKKLEFKYLLNKKKIHPFETVEWAIKDAVIVGSDGKEKFRQNSVEVPAWWSDTTINIVVEKYFRVIDGVRENSAKQMFSRVANWIKENGIAQGLFEEEDADIFTNELLYMFVHGMHAFNSPVWFNVGTKPDPQCSACFIQSVEDTMDSIMDLQKREVLLFKGGSGTGSNLSPLRSSYETLSGGGRPSGPVSFMKTFDSGAGVTKSGGTTRRAAKMVVLNVDHPDILEQANGEPGFITCKSNAEHMAHDLYSTGKYTAEWNKPGNVYDLVGYQNANNSVRVTDDFMQRVITDGKWETRKIKNGEVVHTYDASTIMDKIAEAAWFCGDPGIQFDTATNDWHTCPNSGRINASNPCSEYLFVDDTACNLSSLNLCKFADGNTFKIQEFIHACELAITAKEIIVEASSYPSSRIAEMSKKFRTLGLGYSNLGSLLTLWGLPYDSIGGRTVAAAITALMGGAAYRQSAAMSKILGPFSEYEKNKEAMLMVIRKHWDAAKKLSFVGKNWQNIIDSAYDVWRDAYEDGNKYGFRNAQTTVLAPTGTISFLMDCDTTGIEPMIGCVVYKKVVGEGLLVLPSRTLEPALKNLGYSANEVAGILEFVRKTGSVHGAPFLLPKHNTVFAEALGKHALSPEAHVDMMVAVQPFLSGGISKTVNMPADATAKSIRDIYIRAWQGGLKCVAVYRDKCKLSQPASTEFTEAKRKLKGLEWGNRRKLGDSRSAITHKFRIGSQEGYLTVGLYPDGTLGEVFVRVSKQGSTLMGIVDAWATAVSLSLQYGATFESLKEKFCGMQFEPAGFTDDEDIRIAKSLPDYIFRWLENNIINKKENDSIRESDNVPSKSVDVSQSLDGPPCSSCGNLTKRAGSCFCCSQCGTTTGCS